MFEVSQACSVRDIVMAAKEMLDWPGIFFLIVFQNPSASVKHTYVTHITVKVGFLFKVWIFIKMFDLLFKVWNSKLVNT